MDHETSLYHVILFGWIRCILVVLILRLRTKLCLLYSNLLQHEASVYNMVEVYSCTLMVCQWLCCEIHIFFHEELTVGRRARIARQQVSR
jgi:hypothetical protein